MVLSMTGFGSAKSEDENYRIQVEIKSLNSKFLDLQMRTPRLLSAKEMDLRAEIGKALVRGKVNVMIDVESKHFDDSIINKPLFISSYNELKQLAEEVGYTGEELFKLALQQTEVANTGMITETPEQLFITVMHLVREALQKCIEYRRSEGQNLVEELSSYNSRISELKKEVAALEKGRVERVRERISAELSTLREKEEFDQNRMEQELIYYLEKLDITEELVRLDSHVDYFESILKEPNCGKKLGFLSQELGREINTIGSKANDAEIQKIVVLMKEELEKIKEQSLNVL